MLINHESCNVEKLGASASKIYLLLATLTHTQNHQLNHNDPTVRKRALKAQHINVYTAAWKLRSNLPGASQTDCCAQSPSVRSVKHRASPATDKPLQHGPQIKIMTEPTLLFFIPVSQFLSVCHTALSPSNPPKKLIHKRGHQLQ